MECISDLSFFEAVSRTVSYRLVVILCMCLFFTFVAIVDKSMETVVFATQLV